MHQNKRTKWLDFLFGKCPRCGQRKVFEYSAFNISKFLKMYKQCDNCKLSYEPETGFYFGAMYFSYAIIIGLLVTFAVAGTYAGLGEMLYWLLPLIIIVLVPFIYRYSRLLMLYVVYPIIHKDKFNNTL